MRRALWLTTGALLLMTACSRVDVSQDLADAIAAAEPGSTMHVHPGEYEGPVVVDKPLNIVGGEGVVILAPVSGVGLEIRNTENVSVSHIAIEGGSVGVRVWRADHVTMQDISVQGAARHGILVENAQAIISGCRVEAMVLPYGRGIEVRNADLHEVSEISDCTVFGPVFEGIASRLSKVVFSDNKVVDATETGIAITEMSSGTVSASHVEGGVGAGILCGDMSMCQILDNTVTGVRDAQSRVSTRGHGVVVQYHSVAVVEGLDTSDLAGEAVMESLGGVVNPRGDDRFGGVE